MRFWNKLEKSFLPSRSGKQHAKTDTRERFDAVDEEKLSHDGEAMLSFYRQQGIRGHIRSFQIILDGAPVSKIEMEKQCNILCEPGFHKIHIKLDTMKSQIWNLKAEAGVRYFFEIACTMEEGLILKQVEMERIEEE